MEKEVSKGAKIGYYIGTILLTLLMTFSATMYLAQHEMVVGFFENFGFPTWIIYPLAAAKYLGLIAIWFSKSKTLKHFAYAGFLFDLLLAVGAHLGAGEGIEGSIMSILGIVFWSLSFLFAKKINKV
jgi:hypothetical protein